MNTLHPDEKPAKWPHKQMWERIAACAAMLTIHGFMTDGECKKVTARTNAWLKKHGHRMAW